MKLKLTLAFIIAAITIIAEGCKKTPIVPGNSGGSSNRPPVANAGLDKTIKLPVDKITLDAAKSTDPDNNISTFNWEKISGPSSFTIASPLAIQTEVTNLVEGVYEFELTVVDTKGAYTKDRCRVFVVLDRPAPSIFSVSAWPIYSLITLPTNSITLSAQGFMQPNTVVNLVNIQWSKVSGPVSSTISTPSLLETLITSLVTGVYVFQCKITEANGLSDSARCTVAVTDPSSPYHEIILSNKTWNENGWGFACNDMLINLDQYMPPGKPVKQIFIKPDCASDWIEVFIDSVFTNDDSYDYLMFGNMLNIYWCQDGCVDDIPDIKIVY